MAADGNNARFAAFAGDAHGSVGKINVFGCQAGQLGQAQSRGIKQFEHGPVAHRQRIGVFDFNQLPRVIRRQGIGQALGAFRRTDANARILCTTVIAREIVVEAAPCRQHARNAAAIKATAMQLRNGAADVVRSQLRGRRVAGEREQRGDIALIIFGGMRRQPALMHQVFNVTLQQFADRA